VTVSIDGLDANGSPIQGLYAFVSLDGAMHWHRMAAPPHLTVAGPTATYHGHTYVLYEVDAGQGDATFALAVSDDHLRSWHRVDLAFQRGFIKSVATYEVNGATGGILALTTVAPLTLGTSEAWTSDDGGAHWRSFPLPFGSDGYVYAFTSSDAWHVCNTASSGKASQTYCTLDGGQTWTSLFLPDAPSCGPCASGRFEWR